MGARPCFRPFFRPQTMTLPRGPRSRREARLPAPRSLRNVPPQARSVRAVYALGCGGQGMGQRAQMGKGAGATDSGRPQAHFAQMGRDLPLPLANECAATQQVARLVHAGASCQSWAPPQTRFQAGPCLLPAFLARAWALSLATSGLENASLFWALFCVPKTGAPLYNQVRHVPVLGAQKGAQIGNAKFEQKRVHGLRDQWDLAGQAAPSCRQSSLARSDAPAQADSCQGCPVAARAGRRLGPQARRQARKMRLGQAQA